MQTVKLLSLVEVAEIQPQPQQTASMELPAPILIAPLNIPLLHAANASIRTRPRLLFARNVTLHSLDLVVVEELRRQAHQFLANLEPTAPTQIAISSILALSAASVII